MQTYFNMMTFFDLFFSSRNWKYEQELQSLLWKIDFRDLEIIPHTSQHMTAYPSSFGSVKVSTDVVCGGQKYKFLRTHICISLDCK